LGARPQLTPGYAYVTKKVQLLNLGLDSIGPNLPEIMQYECSGEEILILFQYTVVLLGHITNSG